MMIPNYGEMCRYGEPISTAFVESTINEVIARRMAKKQQMQWSRKGEHKKVWGNHRMARQLGLEYSILLSPSSLFEGAMDDKSGGKVYAMAA